MIIRLISSKSWNLNLELSCWSFAVGFNYYRSNLIHDIHFFLPFMALNIYHVRAGDFLEVCEECGDVMEEVWEPSECPSCGCERAEYRCDICNYPDGSYNDA